MQKTYLIELDIDKDARYVVTKFVTRESCLSLAHLQTFIHPELPVEVYACATDTHDWIKLVSKNLYKREDFPKAVVINKNIEYLAVFEGGNKLQII
jgi:hypothetical protein